jgi:tetratricopeptide (TPR) repeat protein
MAGEETTDRRTRAEFDRLMNLAQINRRRGEYKQADELLRQALELIPTDLDARELAADLLYAHGKWPEAAEAYKLIYEEDASRTAAEEKYAKVLLQIAEGKRQQDLLRNLIEHPEAAEHMPDRSPAIAALLSGIPGLGHVYCGEAVKGAVILLVTGLSWFLFLILRPDVSAYPTLDMRISRFMHDMDPMAIIFLLVALSVHAYAIVNAAVIADKLNNKKTGTL